MKIKKKRNDKKNRIKSTLSAGRMGPTQVAIHEARYGTTVRYNNIPRQSRNDKCACGSGVKYKKCCGGRGTAFRFTLNHARTQAAWKDKERKIMVWSSRHNAAQYLQSSQIGADWFVGGMTAPKWEEFQEHFTRDEVDEEGKPTGFKERLWVLL